MTLGTSLFLSSVLLSIVFLFVATRDRWNWKRISLWAIVTPVALAAVTYGGFYIYSALENRPKPQYEFFGIKLGATPADVKFLKGEPSKKDGEDRWVYHVGPPSDPEATLYLVQFKDGKVRYILHWGGMPTVWSPHLLTFTIGDNYQQVQKALGEPSSTSTSKDDLMRLMSYEKLNVFFDVGKAQVTAYGIYDPKTGPVVYKDNK